MQVLKPGDKVRVKTNPSRIGILSNEVDGPVSRPRVLVHFQDGTDDWLLAVTLEKVEATPHGPYRTIKEGRFGRVDDLLGAITYYRLSGCQGSLSHYTSTKSSTTSWGKLVQIPAG